MADGRGDHHEEEENKENNNERKMQNGRIQPVSFLKRNEHPKPLTIYDGREAAIVAQHVERLKNVVAEIERMADPGENDDEEDRIRKDDIKETLFSQFHELKAQHSVYKDMKQRAMDTLEGEELRGQVERELYRLENRLPALAKRREIEAYVGKGHRFLVIQGQTGSGKSTQIPQYFADHPSFQGKKVICTQPRKIAALSLAQRVSLEYSAAGRTKTGRVVGYQVGGDKRKGSKIEFVTEGVMLERIIKGSDEPFKDVACIVVDEAHERSILCDLLLGSFKKPDPRWKDILIVVTSATIDLKQFSEYFDNAPQIEISGRTFPIRTFYYPLEDSVTGDVGKIRNAVVERAVRIHAELGQDDGDILCFLPGQEDVLTAKEDFDIAVGRHADRGLLRSKSYALFGRQDPDQQQQVFEKLGPNIRKIIFATDVAETSITIDGIVYVVDSGVRKEMVFDPKRNISTLRLTTISKGSATQRAGRAGRTQPGECHRIYSEQDFLDMEPSAVPEVFRRPLSLAILSLIEMNVKPKEFEWISAPSPEAIAGAEEELRYLGAISDDNTSTDLGKMISECQQEPKLVRMIYRGCQDGFGMAALTVASILTVANMFFYIGDNEQDKKDSRASRNKFALEGGDLVTMYRIFHKYIDVKYGNPDDEGNGDTEKGNSKANGNKEGEHAGTGEEIGKRKNGFKEAGEWCKKNFVNGKALGLITGTKKELLPIFKSSAIWKQLDCQTLEPTDLQLRRIIFSGYFLHTARLIQTRGRNPQYFAMHPCISGDLDFRSAVRTTTDNDSPPAWIVFEKILRLNKIIFPVVTPIEESWIEEESPSFQSLCNEKTIFLPTEKVIVQTSQQCVRTIVGRYFVNLQSLEEELDCALEVDVSHGVIAAYCSISSKSEIQTKLQKKVKDVLIELEQEVIDAEYMGGTRVVVGQGFQVKEVLFPPYEFISVFVKQLPVRTTKKDLDSYISRLQLQQKVSNIQLFSYPECKTALIKFRSKKDAHDGFELLNFVKYHKEVKVMQVGLGAKLGVVQAETCKIKLSWASGPSRGVAQICFRSAADANEFIGNPTVLTLGVGSAMVTMVHGDSSAVPNAKKRPEYLINKRLPTVITIRVPKGQCRYRFLDLGFVRDDHQDLDYKVTVAQLSPGIDEHEIYRRLRPKVPKWVKVNRETSDLSALYDSYGPQSADDDSLAKEMEPLQVCLDEDNVRKRFVWDKNLRRAVIYVAIDDKPKLQRIVKEANYSMLEQPFSQPYRVEIEYEHTASVHEDLYGYIKSDIEEIKDIASKKGATVWDSSKNKQKVQRKSKFIFLRFKTCNPGLIRELQSKLESLSNCFRFNHEQIDKLFSGPGRKEIKTLSKDIFVFWNPRNHSLYIYGSKETQDKAVDKLKKAIEELNKIEVIDEQLILNKKNKKQSDTNTITRLCRQAKVEYHEIIHETRLFVSGSSAAVRSLREALTKEGLLFTKKPTSLSKFSRGRQDCPLCLTPPEGEFLVSSLCPDAFCIECLEPMLSMLPPKYPVLCPACEVPLGIADIQKIAKPANLRKILEVAVMDYQKKHEDEVLLCPKPECGQLLSVLSKTIGKYGGEFYFCDECVSTYCLPCSFKAEKPIRSHEFDSCEDVRIGQRDEVRQYVTTIQETIFTLRCPRCQAAFLDFDGCAAVSCASCGCGFCGVCLKDCGQDAHSHVRKCDKNPNKGSYYINPPSNIDKAHLAMRLEKLKEFFSSMEKPELGENVFRCIRRDLADLGISEGEVSIMLPKNGEGQITELVLQHVKIIHDSILNLHCPRCKAVFLDFEGCAAVQCNCGCEFCGMCLEECGGGEESYAHLRHCPKNPKVNEYFVEDVDLKKIHCELKMEKLKKYIKENIRSPEVLQAVLNGVRDDLISLGAKEEEINAN